MLQNKPRKDHCLRWALTLLVVGGCGYAQAQLTNCKDPGPHGDFKIFVDEVRATGNSANSPEVQQKLQSIRDFLSNNLRVSAAEKASVRDCGKRFPNDPSDFDGTEFDGLDSLRVVLEVWGVLEDPARGSGTIGLALVPARPFSPPAVYVVPSPNLLDTLQQGKQMSAFAPLVLGIRQYQNKKYAEAVPLLCRGAHDLDALLQGQNAPGDAPFRARQLELLQKVKEITDKAIREAMKVEGSQSTLWSPGSDGNFACPQ